MNFRIERKKNHQLLFFDHLERIASIKHAVFLELDSQHLLQPRSKNAPPFFKDHMPAQSELLQEVLPFEILVTLRQIHTNRCVLIEKADIHEVLGADGDCLFTSERSVAIAVKTADCFPLFVVDAREEVISCVHAGWRGIALGVIEACLQRMKQDFSCKAEDMLVSVGPGIEKCCYTVKEDAIDFFRSNHCNIDDHLIRSGPSFTLSLSGIIQDKLLRNGIRSGNIVLSGLCTYCSDLHLPSFRRDGKQSQRTLSAIMLA